jgi:hypothetical protein
MAERLGYLTSHEGLFLLRSSLAIPRLQHILRSSPCFDSPVAIDFDASLRSILSKVSNCNLSDEAWSQAVLPVRWGGLGLRSIAVLACSAFLSSLTAAEALIATLIASQHFPPLSVNASQAEAVWIGLSGEASAIIPRSHSQRVWDQAVCSHLFSELLNSAPEVSRARLLASQSPMSGCWLSALPSPSLGLYLGDAELRIAIGLRLGCSIVREHICRCGTQVTSAGLHGLSCRKSAGRQSRHSSINAIISRALNSADVPTELEPNGLHRSDGRRPDGATLVPWSHGRCLLWDFTCPDTVAPSHISNSSIAAGSAASLAEVHKTSKYAGLTPTYIFTPVAIETFGSWGPEAVSFVSDLGRRIAERSGEPRSTEFLRQRMDIALQRGNAASVLGTLVADSAGCTGVDSP